MGKKFLALVCKYLFQLFLASALGVRALQHLHKWGDLWLDIHGSAVPHGGRGDQLVRSILVSTRQNTCFLDYGPFLSQENQGAA